MMNVLSPILLSFVRQYSTNGIIMNRYLKMIKRHVITIALIPIEITMKEEIKNPHNIYFRKEIVNDVYSLFFFSSFCIVVACLRE